MKATDLNFSKELKFNIETGMTTFRDHRLVIFDADAIGLLRQQLIEKISWAEAREFFLKFSFQNGYADCMQLKLNYQFDTEMDLLAAGPVIHTWEGIVHAKPVKIQYDRKTGDFYMSGIWTNSYEVEQHLTFNEYASEPVCWSLMGYASGYATAFFGSPLIAIESRCVGKGDEHCEWVIQPISAWGKKAEIYLHAYQHFFQSLQL